MHFGSNKKSATFSERFGRNCRSLLRSQDSALCAIYTRQCCVRLSLCCTVARVNSSLSFPRCATAWTWKTQWLMFCTVYSTSGLRYEVSVEAIGVVNTSNCRKKSSNVMTTFLLIDASLIVVSTAHHLSWVTTCCWHLAPSVTDNQLSHLKLTVTTLSALRHQNGAVTILRLH